MEATTITCTFSGLLESTAVTWKTDNVEDLSVILGDNYVIETGLWEASTSAEEPSTLESKLTINRNKLDELTEAATYTCCVMPAEETVFEESHTLTVSKPGRHASFNAFSF